MATYGCRMRLVSLLIPWLSASLGLFVASRVLRGVRLATVGDALWAGALLALVNWGLHWLLFVALGIATLGIGFLFWFITNWIVAAFVVLITARLSSRLSVDGFWPALVTAFIVSVAESVVRWAM
jgi:uncharacterized membrane protein YvlD (DUF360 family)